MAKCAKTVTDQRCCHCPPNIFCHVSLLFLAAQPTNKSFLILEPICDGGDNCCTTKDTCQEGEGDCNVDADCTGDLKCGFNNCPVKSEPSFDKTDDCCYNPGTAAPTSFDGK